MEKCFYAKMMLFLVCAMLCLCACTYNRTIVLEQRPVYSQTDSLNGQKLDYKEQVEISNPLKK